VTLLWAGTGSYFRYSDTWQLVINTGTSIGTFLIVFLIQNTQNRDAKVMQLKLDELIRAVKTARTELVQMEGLTDLELEELQKDFQFHRDQAMSTLECIADSRRRLQSLQNTT
jgi:low affinity Fe/Cu permease